MIKWEHSVFALPFALTGAVLAAGGWPRAIQLFWIVVCMITARSAAMAFNRWADADLDAANPRTASRAIPAGLLSRGFVAVFTVAMALLFVFSASRLNRLSLLLSPAAAWIAIRGRLDARILVLTGAVLFWVAGFDVLYACQDMEHDRVAGLWSIPRTLGLHKAFGMARAMHGAMLVLLMWLLHLFHLGPIAWWGLVVVMALLFYEHSIVSPKDMRRLNAAFFTLNGIISVLFFCFVALAVTFHR
jgi:4-hydroxybenzoate polyprenyltransferase